MRHTADVEDVFAGFGDIIGIYKSVKIICTQEVDNSCRTGDFNINCCRIEDEFQIGIFLNKHPDGNFFNHPFAEIAGNGYLAFYHRGYGNNVAAKRCNGGGVLKIVLNGTVKRNGGGTDFSDIFYFGPRTGYHHFTGDDCSFGDRVIFGKIFYGIKNCGDLDFFAFYNVKIDENPGSVDTFDPYAEWNFDIFFGKFYQAAVQMSLLNISFYYYLFGSQFLYTVRSSLKRYCGNRFFVVQIDDIGVGVFQIDGYIGKFSALNR